MHFTRITYKILGVFQHDIGDRHHIVVSVRICFTGAGTISWEFLSQSPERLSWSEREIIWPAIVGACVLRQPLSQERYRLLPAALHGILLQRRRTED